MDATTNQNSTSSLVHEQCFSTGKVVSLAKPLALGVDETTRGKVWGVSFFISK